MQLDGRDVGVLSMESPGVRNEWEMHPDDMLHVTQGRAAQSGRDVAPTRGTSPLQDVVSNSGDDPSGVCARIRMAPSDGRLPTDV
jgi:hypothetical protein